MRVRVKLNFISKDVVKMHVALYTKVIDGVCHCMYMTKHACATCMASAVPRVAHFSCSWCVATVYMHKYSYLDQISKVLACS